jgi:hypothetical protein
MVYGLWTAYICFVVVYLIIKELLKDGYVLDILFGKTLCGNNVKRASIAYLLDVRLHTWCSMHVLNSSLLTYYIFFEF